MKKTVIIYGTSTGTCEDLAGRIGAKLGVDNVINVTDLDDSVIADNDNLILGTSTWGAGEVQDDWYDGLKVIKNADLSGKTVALFGCGDSESYPDTFVGGMAEIYNAVKDICELRGYQLVIDRASDNGIIYGSPKIDISAEVLSKLGY